MPDLSQVQISECCGSKWRIACFQLVGIQSPALAHPSLTSATVYTLWQHPHLVPLLHTPDFVVDKMQTGSPLMTPGLAFGPPFPAKATKGAVVAVASVEHPSVPRVVGICEIDVSSLQKVQGSKGHAVRSEHWEGDEIWAWSTSGKPGNPAPASLKGWEISEEEMLQKQAADLDISDDEDDPDEGGVQLAEVTPVNKRNNHVEGEDAEPFERVDMEEEKELSIKEIDDAFWQAFLYSVHEIKAQHKSDPHRGLKFPIPPSLVMSNMVLPYLPTHTALRTANLTIKKTSWKNIRKFIKALEKAKILKSKDRDGWECVIVDIDFEDPAITDFKPYPLPKKDAPSSTPTTHNLSSSSSSSSDPSVGQNLHLITLHRPSTDLSALLPTTTSSTTTRHLYPANELRSLLTTHFESASLVSSTNKRHITLNPTLHHLIFPPSAPAPTSPIDRDILVKNSIPRDMLLTRLLDAHTTPHWALLRNDADLSTATPKAGHPPKITITLETRSGNKTMTKVSGLEAFGIAPGVLAEELQKSCASSTSVGQLAGSSPRNPVGEVLVQGPQRDAVVKAVERRGVRREWVVVVDKTKGKKGGGGGKR